MVPHAANEPPLHGHSHTPKVLGGCGAEQEAAEEENLLREISPAWMEAPAPAAAKCPWSDPRIRASPARRLPAPGGAPGASGHPWCSGCRPSLVLPVPAIPGALGTSHPWCFPPVCPFCFAAHGAAPGSHWASSDMHGTSDGDRVTPPGTWWGLVSAQAPHHRVPMRGGCLEKRLGAGTMTSWCQSGVWAGKESVTTELSAPSLSCLVSGVKAGLSAGLSPAPCGSV